jgi:TPR repeat protein
MVVAVAGLALGAVVAAGADLSAARKGCEAGKAADCVRVGLARLKGDGVAKSTADGIALLKKACDAGSGAGCSHLGNVYQHGRGVRTDTAAAASLYERGCESGDAFGCMGFSITLAGQGHRERARTVLARTATLAGQACDSGQTVAGRDGDMSGCTLLAGLYGDGLGVGKDEKRAAALFEKGCSAGDTLGCSSLGEMYASGKGVPRDAARAVAFFVKACDGGECDRLGAAEIEQACNAGSAAACATLGNFYRLGNAEKGVAEDAARAVRFYDRACQGRHANSCLDLGVMTKFGAGVAADEAKGAALETRGIALYDEACKGGDLEACYSLAGKFEHGVGVPTDGGRAAALYKQACEAGWSVACFALDRNPR